MPLQEGSDAEALMNAVRLHAGQDGVSKLADVCGGTEIEIGATLAPDAPLVQAFGFDHAEKIRKEVLIFDADGNVVRCRCYVPSGKAMALREQIKGLLLEGCNSIEVAKRAGVSLKTVFRHVKRLREEGCNAPLLVRRQTLTALDMAIMEGSDIRDVARAHRRSRSAVRERADNLVARGVIPANPYAALPKREKGKNSKTSRALVTSRAAPATSPVTPSPKDAPRRAREARP